MPILPFKLNQDRRHHIPRQRHKVTNWPRLWCMDHCRVGWGRMVRGRVPRHCLGWVSCRSKPTPSVATTSQSSGTGRRTRLPTMRPCMDADTGQIAAAVLTTSDIDDASQVGPLLDQVSGPLASFTADGAYDQDGVYGQVAARHPEASVIVPPRSSAVPSDTAQTAPPLLFQPLRGWNLEQLRRPCETGTCRSSPSAAAWPGRRPRAITGVPWWRQTSVASNGLSVMGGAGQGSACAARGIPAEGTIPHRSTSRDRGHHRRGRTEPNARTRASGVRPPHITATQRNALHRKRPIAAPCNTVKRIMNSCRSRLRSVALNGAGRGMMPSTMPVRHSEICLGRASREVYRFRRAGLFAADRAASEINGLAVSSDTLLAMM